MASKSMIFGKNDQLKNRKKLMDYIKPTPQLAPYAVALPKDKFGLMRWINLADFREISFDGENLRIIFLDGSSLFFSGEEGLIVANAVHRLSAHFGTQILGEEPEGNN